MRGAKPKAPKEHRVAERSLQESKDRSRVGIIRGRYYGWLKEEGADLPPSIGQQPVWYDSL